MIEKNTGKTLSKEEKEAAKLEKKRLADEKKALADAQVGPDGATVEDEADEVLTEDDELTLAEARRIVAENKKKRNDAGFSGPVARVFNGKTTYAVFSKEQYGEGYQKVATDWAHDRGFTVEFI